MNVFIALCAVPIGILIAILVSIKSTSLDDEDFAKWRSERDKEKLLRDANQFNPRNES